MGSGGVCGVMRLWNMRWRWPGRGESVREDEEHHIKHHLKRIERTTKSAVNDCDSNILKTT